MAKEQRIQLIKALENERKGRLVIAYVTSTRIGHELQMGDDILPRLFHHLELGKKSGQTKKGVDLFIHSNGGSGTVPWRIVNLIREYTDSFAVLIPHHAFSAATLVSLGADSIVMHKMGLLGPIDPSVTTPFNPPNPQSPGQLVPISVEDVSAYFTFVKEEVGIQHEDELVQALIALTEKIPPLALGTVQRTHNQSRMLAGKLLRKHMLLPTQSHEIETIIENLKSNFYYHGHPINRYEARVDLKLKVEFAEGALEDAMWNLYESYEEELKLNERFNPLHELELYQQRSGVSAPAAPITTQQILAQMQQLAQSGLGLAAPGSQGGLNEEQIVRLAAAMIPIVSATPGVGQSRDKCKLERLKSGYLESVDRTDVFLSDLTVERTKVNTPAGPQDATKQEPTWQRWEIES
ncbi:MAG: hypothetical protein WCD12_15270 [Candidatus Binatus sp.]|jgi:hypothetical protein|uniref:SDH family Clp fold serine proteinase n=1 Tax=Candidatus Binatus sp. TaxID=2811406 RepID=UPI003C7524D5